MKFPKARMSTTELIKMGFTKEELLCLAHKKGQNYATQVVPGGKIRWDTERLQKELDKQLIRS